MDSTAYSNQAMESRGTLGDLEARLNSANRKSQSGDPNASAEITALQSAISAARKEIELNEKSASTALSNEQQQEAKSKEDEIAKKFVEQQQQEKSKSESLLFLADEDEPRKATQASMQVSTQFATVQVAGKTNEKPDSHETSSVKPVTGSGETST